MKGRILRLALAYGAIVSAALFYAPQTSAVGIPTGDFSLEVSPSPLVVTVQPSKPVTVDLKIRNASLKPENLKIEARSFDISADSQNINLSTSTPADLASWVSYAHPTFTVQPGEWFTQRITIALPDSAGFSYPFAVVISRAQQETPNTGGNRLLEGSVAVFTLVNVNKPGATRKLELESLTASQPIYEYLPATISVKLKNTGNSIVQPYGNIYMQRNSKATQPLSVLPLNNNRSYILPGTSKEFSATWDDGYPVYKGDGDKRTLEWSPESTSHIRIGQYTAKVVAVYNDGARDVPITGEVTFWVIPWKLLLGVLVLIILLVIGVWSLIRRITGKIRSFRLPKQR